MTLSHPASFLPTANDRLKAGFEVRLALSFVAAVMLHGFVFELWPAMQAPDWAPPTNGVVKTLPAQKVDLPDDPPPVRTPMLPVASATASVDVTMTVPGWRDVVTLPEPVVPAESAASTGAIPFTPYTVGPTLANPREVQRALSREYPPLLRDAGLGGTVNLLVHIDAQGRVLEARTDGSSGMEGLDAAALRVSEVFRFNPALNRDQAVEVWIRLPVVFQVR